MSRRMLPVFALLLLTSPVFAQRTAPATSSSSSDVDEIVSLLQGKMSEAIIVNSIQTGDAVYKLTPADLVKLQKAGASDRVIEAMQATASKPAGVPAPSAAVPAAPASATTSTRAAPAAPATPVNAKGAQNDKKQDDKKGGGLFSRIGDRLKKTATNTADTAESTVEKTADSSASAVDTSVTKTADAADSKVDQNEKKLTEEIPGDNKDSGDKSGDDGKTGAAKQAAGTGGARGGNGTGNAAARGGRAGGRANSGNTAARSK